jgi:PAS domain S-box-containing protein
MVNINTFLTPKMAESKTSILELEHENILQKKEIERLRALLIEKERLGAEYNNSQHRFKTVFEESSVGKKIINAELKIIRVNKSLVRMLGYSEEELSGRRIIEFTHPDFVALWESLRRELWESRRVSFSLDTCLIKKDQSTIWCHVTSILFEDNGETLGYTILEDISERKELEQIREESARQALLVQQLQFEQDKQRDILTAIINAQEQERKRIAEGLHNGLGQLLFGAKLSLDQVEMRKPERYEQNQAVIEKTKQLLSDCIRECRQISHEMMPTLLADFGLKEAVLDICDRLGGKVAFECVFTGQTVKLEKHIEILVYRTVQELMLNVVKHADASRATLKIKIGAKDISIMVQDNGKGLEEDKLNGGGIGIKTIKGNMRLFKGTFEILSDPGKGTTINILLPY